MTHPMLSKMVDRMFAEFDWDGEPFAGTLCTSEMETLARAAVQSLLEPDEGMKQAGANELFGSVEKDWGEDARRVFRAMLLPLVEGEGE